MGCRQKIWSPPTKELVRRLLFKRKAEIVSLFYGRDVIQSAAGASAAAPSGIDPEWELP